MRKPSALLYPVFVLAIFGSALFFWNTVRRERTRVTDAVAHFQRFIGPGFGLFEESTKGEPNRGAAVLEFKEPGEYSVCYESQGLYQEYPGDAGEAFDTPTRQLWPTKDRLSMDLAVTRNDGADNGEKIAVRIAGLEPDAAEQARIEKNPRTAMPKNRGLFVYRREVHGRTGHAVWLVEIPAPGFYKFETRYVAGTGGDPEAIAVPPELSKAEKQAQKITAPEVQARDKERRDAEEDRELARIKHLPVLFAVGKDPLAQSLFEPTGMYGAAGICAFVITLSLAGMLLVAAFRGRKAQ